MSPVICNTSPLYYLHQLQLLPLLPALFGSIWVPQAVCDELAQGAKTGCQIPDLAQNPWIVAKTVVLDPGIAALDHLGDGEKAVLSLGLLHPKGLLILDDLAARQTAEQNSLNLIGTLGILLAAKKQSHLSLIGPVLNEWNTHQEVRVFFDDDIAAVGVHDPTEIAGEA